MLVKNWMSTPVVTIGPNNSMQEAMELLKARNISMLPVVDNGRLVGIITDGDLKKAAPSDATTLEIHELLYLLASVKVKDIMSHYPITVPVDFTIEETSEILVNNKIPGMPVVDKNGVLVGILTHTDLFKVILSLTGMKKESIQFAFRLNDAGGEIFEAAQALREFGAKVISVFTSHKNVPEGLRNVYIRASFADKTRLDALKAKLKEHFTLLYIVDHETNIREVFTG